MHEEIIRSRVNFDKLGENYPSASGVSVEKQVVEDIDCYWFKTSKETNYSEIAVYLHGGCFVLGSVRSHQALVSHLAQFLELPIIFIDYSLAPEKPYPNAVNDIYNVFCQLKIHYPKSNFVFIGDSAGGWLSMALIAELTKSGLQLPKYQVLISPWIDLSCSNNSISENAEIDPILNKNRLIELASLYMTDRDRSGINLTDTIYKHFPPTLIIAGSREILLDDSRLLFDKISKVQPVTKLSIYENQTHVWLLDSIDSEQSQNALHKIKAFINNQLNDF